MTSLTCLQAKIFVAVTAVCLITCASSGATVFDDETNHSIPHELIASDPEIQTLLSAGDKGCSASLFDARIEAIAKAKRIADEKGLVSDRAIVNATFGITLLGQGRTDEAFLALKDALQDAMSANNTVLQADILISLSGEAQLKGNPQQATDLVKRALDLAIKSDNLYVKARALGELGRLDLIRGKLDESGAALDQALDIDRLNGYKFEALHLFYKASELGVSGHEQEASEYELRARAKAIEANDVYTFVQAESGYALALARAGNVKEAIRQMDSVSAGELTEFVQKPNERECFALTLQVPFVRMVLLEAFTNVLHASNQLEREIQIWREFYLIGEKLGLTAGEAEAEHKIADIENSLKRSSDASNDYAAAARFYKQIGDAESVDQVEIAEALLLIRLERPKEAVKLVNDIVEYARLNKRRVLEFSADLELAEVYQPAGELDRARIALEAGRELIAPGPFDTEIGDKATHELFVRQSDVYRGLKQPAKELAAIDQAYFVSEHSHDEESKKRELAYLDQRLTELGIRSDVSAKESAGQLSDALVYSYVLYIRDGYPAKATDDRSSWQRIFDLPFKLVQQPGGAESLKAILRDFGSIVGFQQMPLLSALGRFYVLNGNDAGQAEKYALRAQELTKSMNGNTFALQAENSCILAQAYAQQQKVELARRTSAECLALARSSDDPQTIKNAEIRSALADAALGNYASSRFLLEALIEKSPEDSQLHSNLAAALASAKLYQQSESQLAIAANKLISSGNKKAAEEAERAIAIVLASDSSEPANQMRLRCLQSALELSRSMDDQSDQAVTLVLLGDYFLAVRETKESVKNYERAREISERVPQGGSLATALLGLGNAYQADKDFQRAAEFHLKASAAFRATHNQVGLAVALRDLGQDYFEAGETDKALPTLLDARKESSGAGALHQYLSDLFLSDLYRSQGQFDRSLETLRDAENVTESAGLVDQCAFSHLASAQVETIVGAWDDSLADANAALKLYQSSGNKSGQGDVWALMTDIYADRSSSLKNFKEAHECYLKAEECGYGKGLQLDLMEMDLQTADFTEATKIAADRLQDCRSENDSSCEANAFVSLSEARRSAGNLRDARSALESARPMVSNGHDVYLEGRFKYAESRLLVSEGKLQAALVSYKSLIQLIETVRGRLNPRDQRAVEENYGYIFDELVALIYSISERSAGRNPQLASEALNYAERNKARQFNDTWGQLFESQMRLALPPPLQARETALYSKRDELTAKLANAPVSGQGDSGQLQSQLSLVQIDIANLVTELRKEAPQYAAIAYPEPVGVSSLILKKNETLIEFKMTDDAAFVWVVQTKAAGKPEAVMFYKIPKTRAWFTERLSSLRVALNAGRPELVDWKASEALFDAMFPQSAAEILAGSDEVIFIPDDVLFVLPFELLSHDASHGEFSLLKKSTTYYPSAVSLQLARSAIRPNKWQSTFLGIADPVTSPEDERFDIAKAVSHGGTPEANSENGYPAKSPDSEATRLTSRGYSFDRIPGTATEVRGIAALLTKANESAEVRLGMAASKRDLLNTDLSKYRFIHFATHGVLPVDAGIQEPALIMSYDGIAPSHMFLSMSEILALKLRSESVVLSACNTGSGKVSRAEGVMSLGRAFLAAGASSVTVSLWQVSDDSTALLMQTYYKALLEKKEKSAALAEARSVVYSSGSKNPFFWAPFIVIGD